MYQTGKSLGRHGESLAVKYLISKGYTILEQGFRSRSGEVDIICRPPAASDLVDTLVFVEVKTRRSLAFGVPHDSVTDLKLKRIHDTATRFTERHTGPDPFIRIDVISIVYHRGDFRLDHLVDVTGSF